ncbi:MAG: hypothetical protein HN809_08435 [Rhodospirillaceae bacterium]|jgi:hypothetical protein|nr:hypothetical protein [Rhodospirillaceae bacterium]
MNTRSLSILAIVLWIVGAATVANLYFGGKTNQGTDNREAVMLNVDERDLILAEMRLMLGAVQGIIAAVADDDMKAVQEISLAIGMEEVKKVPKSLMLKLPMDFKTMGKDNHVEFDEVAEISKQGGRAVLNRLSELLVNCVGCHEEYSLQSE